MTSNQIIRYAIMFGLATVFILAMVSAVMLNTDFGTVEVREVRIPNQDNSSEVGLLYLPNTATAEARANREPACAVHNFNILMRPTISLPIGA